MIDLGKDEDELPVVEYTFDKCLSKMNLGNGLITDEDMDFDNISKQFSEKHS